MGFFLKKVQQRILNGCKEYRTVLLLSGDLFCQFFRRDFAQIVAGPGFRLLQIFSDFPDAVVFVIVDGRIIEIALKNIIKINIHHKDDMQIDVSQGRETGAAIFDKVLLGEFA